MYKKIWACLRHDLYQEIKRQRKENREELLNPADFDRLYEEQHKRFEDIRVCVYELIMGEEGVKQ